MSSKNETFQLVKDVGVMAILDGRKLLANGFYAIAEKVDITAEQETFSANTKLKIRQKRLEKERLHAAGARA